MIRLGIMGLGAAGQAFLPPVREHPAFRLAAACDLSEEARTRLAQSDAVPVFAGLPEMLAGVELDAVYIGTPTDMHRDHVLEVFRSGKHVLVEKPMAIEADDGREMVRAAEAAGRVLVVGHSHSHDLPIRKMREIILSGRLGRVRMVNSWCYTDWVYRPRRPEELRPDLGGGVTYRQGAHQFDILRSLCDDEVVSVSANAFDWDPARSTVGAHVVTLRFAGGAVGTAVYNGYGRFRTTELTQSVGEWGFPAKSDAPPAASSTAETEAEELARKRARALNAIGNDAPHQPHFGLTVVSCEKGDMRQSPDGILVYTRDGREEIALPGGVSPRRLVLDEFAAAIDGGERPLHDGRWGTSIVEICAAALRSAEIGRPVDLPPQHRA